jgi:uncharacterized membrane protein YcaP (DUF421 family)
MENIFFDSWESTQRTFLITIMAYAVLIVMLRTSGKRTLSKMNAFDMIVTIALGSTLANVTLDKQVALLDGALALALLVYLQYLITWLSARSDAIQNLVKSSPTLLVYKGEMDRERMKKERVTEEEIHEAAREHGCSSLRELEAVILETTGELNVIKEIGAATDEVLTSVRNFPG